MTTSGKITAKEASILLAHVGLEDPGATPSESTGHGMVETVAGGCPACGKPTKPYAHYCGKCGAKLDGKEA